MRHELAIAVQEDYGEAVTLVWLFFGLVSISTGITTLEVLFLGDQLVAWLNEPALNSLLWVLPLGVLLSGVYQPLSCWAVRRKQFGCWRRASFSKAF